MNKESKEGDYPPAAGLGTRFLPATKAMPKEMLPIVDKPTIQYIVEEAIDSGIEDIIIVTGKGKRAIEDHFDYAHELEQNLLKKGKTELLDKVRYATNLADIHYICQKEPKGLGHAVWCARNFIWDEPFAVLLGEDIVQSDTPCLKQLINQYEETLSSVIRRFLMRKLIDMELWNLRFKMVEDMRFRTLLRNLHTELLLLIWQLWGDIFLHRRFLCF
jgi:UTP-glucose-1-phosphate uridylyltransferase